MKHHNFLKTSFALALASSLLMTKILLTVYASPAQQNSDHSSYKPGEHISPDAFVLDKDLNPHTLLDLIQDSGAQVTMLYIYGGGAMNKPDKIGGIGAAIHLKTPTSCVLFMRNMQKIRT